MHDRAEQAKGGLYSRGYGGDTLNTSVYLARLGVDVDYVTALGDDTLSDEMIGAGSPKASGPSASRGCRVNCRAST